MKLVTNIDVNAKANSISGFDNVNRRVNAREAAGQNSRGENTPPIM